jgi:hypothetical protein
MFSSHFSAPFVSLWIYSNDSCLANHNLCLHFLAITITVGEGCRGVDSVEFTVLLLPSHTLYLSTWNLWEFVVFSSEIYWDLPQVNLRYFMSIYTLTQCGGGPIYLSLNCISSPEKWYFLAILGFELGVLYWLGKHSSTWAMPPAPRKKILKLLSCTSRAEYIKFSSLFRAQISFLCA